MSTIYPRLKMKNKDTKSRIAFFGTPDLSVWVLEALAEKGVLPDLVVCAPDAPKGRKLVMTPPPSKTWAQSRNIPVIQPQSVRSVEFEGEIKALGPWDLFIVAAYGKLIPESVLDIPRAKTINIHPSLLPKLRGSSPLQGAILADMRETGVTIMRLDKEMDHGPIIAQKKVEFVQWPVDQETLGKILAKEGGYLIALLKSDLIAGTTTETAQDHSQATYTKKISKEDGEIDLSADPYKNWLKFNAYKGWPGSYYFVERAGKKCRVSLSEATYKSGAFVILKVIPEGKKEMSWAEFERTGK